jgi:putative membrane protein
MIHHQRMFGRLAAVTTLALVAACGGDAANDTMNDTMAPTVGAAGDTMAAGAGAMNDTTIIGMMSGANGAEIAAGQAAAEKAQNADVRQFATTMVEEHQRMQGQVDSLVSTMNVSQAPVPDSLAQHLEQARTQLTGQAAGAEFDRMYMEMQVADHQNTLNALRAAQSAAQNAQLRTIIDGAIPAVEQHLERARTIVANLGG